MSMCNENRNHQKKLEGLRGILQGISADGTLNEQELLYLDTWLRDTSELHVFGDVIDLIEQISDVLEDGVVTQEEIEDTLSLIEDIEEYTLSNLDSMRDEGLLNEFIGFALGVTSDGKIAPSEKKRLMDLLKNLDTHPMCKRLSQDLKTLRNDDAAFLEKVKSFCGQNFLESGSSQNLATSSIFDDVESLLLDGLKICFTGTIPGLSRSELKKQAELLGCKIAKNPTLDTDLVIVGEDCSKDWIYTSYGRKVEIALKHKEKGASIKIISSSKWFELV